MTTSLGPSAPTKTLSTGSAGMTYRGRSRLGKWAAELGWRHLVGALAVAFALFPILFVAQAALNPSGTLSGATSGWSSFVPTHVSGHNFTTLLHSKTYPFADWLLSSLLICCVTTLFAIFFSSCGAFAFSRLRFRGRRMGLLGIILVQMLPNFIAVTALYLMFVSVGNVFPLLAPGRISLVLVYLGGSFGIGTWLIKGYMDTVPNDLDEAAKVDGASHAQIFFRIVIPLAAPILVVMSIITFISTLNDLILAQTFLTGGSEADKTVLMGLSGLVQGGVQNTNYGMFAAGAIMCALPVVALFLIFQRFIVGGLIGGAVKS
jgi:arabinogalactan oligomer/maltooligosaccharide transport system permease protein